MKTTKALDLKSQPRARKTARSPDRANEPSKVKHLKTILALLCKNATLYTFVNCHSETSEITSTIFNNSLLILVENFRCFSKTARWLYVPSEGHITTYR